MVLLCVNRKPKLLLLVRNLVRRAAAVYSGRESFIVYLVRNETARGHF